MRLYHRWGLEITHDLVKNSGVAQFIGHSCAHVSFELIRRSWQRRVQDSMDRLDKIVVGPLVDEKL